MEAQTSNLSPFHRLVDSPFNANDIDPKARELIFHQLQLLRKEKYADFKRYVVTKSSSLYCQSEWVSDSWELCCYGNQVEFDDFQAQVKQALLPFDVKTLNFYQSTLKKQFGGEDTTVSTALLQFNSIHWIAQFSLSHDSFGQGTSISYRPIYELDMMKAYNMKQAKKSAVPTRYMPMKSSYRPHESFADLFTPRKQIKLDNSVTNVATPDKITSIDYQLKNESKGQDNKKQSSQKQSNLRTKEAQQKDSLKRRLLSRKLALEKELEEFNKADQVEKE